LQVGRLIPSRPLAQPVHRGETKAPRRGEALIKTEQASFASPASLVHKEKRLEEIFQVLHF